MRSAKYAHPLYRRVDSWDDARVTEADNTPPQWKVGQLMQRARETAGYSKRQAAEKAGISEGRWRQLEDGWEVSRGVRQPVRTTPKTMAQIAHAMGIDESKLLRAAGFRPDQAAVADVVREQRSIDVSDLTVDEIAQVRSYISFLKRERGHEG